MVLAGHSNASYLSETNARSRAGGHFFMSNNDAIPNNKGAILRISQIIKAVMSSVAEAKIGALYINCKEAIPTWHTLEFLGHKQPPTPMQTDNTTALGVVNNNIMKKLKSMNMKYHWLWCYKSTSILPLLGGGKIKQQWLCHQTSRIHPSPNNTTNFSHPNNTLQKLCDRIQSQLPIARVCYVSRYPVPYHYPRVVS